MANIITDRGQAAAGRKNMPSSRQVLTVSAYDRTATTIIALLVLLGASVIGLGVIFFSNKLARTVPMPIALAPVEATSPTANGGIGTDPDPPGMEDGAELAEPQLGATLEAVSEAAAFSPVAFAEEGTAAAAGVAGAGSGLGDGRAPGPGSEGVIERVPRWQRWKIRFEPESREDFANWLDQFQIRVGVLGTDNRVHLAWHFSEGAPQIEAAEPAKYAAWGQTVPADGPMPALATDLARESGILATGTIVLLFYPFEVESHLWTLEKESNKTGDANRVRETIFTVDREGGEFRFKVAQQRYF